MPARRKLRAEQAGAEVEGSPAAKAGHHGADGAAAEAVAGATASSRRSSLPTIALGLISRPASSASSPGRGARPSSEDPRRNSRDVVEKQTAGGADGAKVKVEGMEAGGLARGLEANLKTADLHLSKAFAGGRVYCASLVDKLPPYYLGWAEGCRRTLRAVSFSGACFGACLCVRLSPAHTRFFPPPPQPRNVQK